MNVQSVNAIANYYKLGTFSTPVSVAQALSAVKLNPRAKFTIEDKAANIESNFASLAAIVNNVESVTLTDLTKGFIAITSKKLLSSAGASLTNKMVNLSSSNNISLNVLDATANDIATLKLNAASKIGQISIKDSTLNIANKFDSLASFETTLGDIQLTDPGKFLKLRSDQYSSSEGPSGTKVLSHLVGTYGLEISGVSTDQAIEMALDTKVAKVNIVDSAQNIADKLNELQDLGLKVNTIKTDNVNDILFKISGEKLQRDAAVIGKIYKGYQLAVFNIDSGTALSVKSNKKIVSLDIVDTAAGISKNMALLGKLGNQLHSLQITDIQSPLSMTVKDFYNNETLLNKIVRLDTVERNAPVDPVLNIDNVDYNNKYKVDIVDSTSVDAQSIKDNEHINFISVKDSSAAISININDLNVNSKVKNIVVSGTNNTISLSFAQLTSDATVIDLLKNQNGNLKFNVNGVSAADAKDLILSTANRVASVSVSDSADNIVSKLSDLTALGKNLTTILQTDARVLGAQGKALRLTANNWMLHIGALSKISGGYGVSLMDVGAAKAISLANDVRVKSFEVLDSAAEISANFDTLRSLGSKLASIKQSGSGAIDVTGRQYSSQGNILSKFESTYTLSVKNALANQINSFVEDKDHINSVQVLDTVDNIAGNMVDLQEAANLVPLGSSITVSIAGTPKPFTLSVTDLDTYKDALKVIQGNYKVNVSDVEATDAKVFAEDDTLPIHDHLNSMVVKASSEDLSNADLLADLNSLGNKISKLSQKDVGSMISISKQAWESNSNLFSKMNGYQVSLSDVSASAAKTLLMNEHVAKIQVVDTGSQISRNLDTLMALGSSVTSIKQQEEVLSNLQLDARLWNAASDTLAKIENNYKVDLLSATANDAISVANNDTIDTVSIKDSAVEISTNFDSLIGNNKISNIVLNGAVSPIKISQTQFYDGTSLLDHIQGGYTLDISDADVIASANLIANNHVVSVEMSGSADDISDQLSVLSQFGAKLKSLSVTDENPTMSLSFSNFQKYKNVLSQIRQNFKINLTDAKASDAVTQGSDSQFNLSFSVKDSAVQIASNFDGLSALKVKLTSITTNDDPNEDPPVLKLKSTQYLSNQDLLAKINSDKLVSPYQLALTGGGVSFAQSLLSNEALAGTISTLEITDSAENIGNSFDLISDSKVLSARLTVGASTLSLTGEDYSNSSTLAKIKGSFDINVINATPSQTTDLEADSRVSSYSLAAASSSIGGSLPDLLELSKLAQVNITQDATEMSVSLSDYVLIEDQLGKLVGNFGLNVTGVKASDLESLADKNEISSIEISDSSENISGNWDGLMSLGDKLKSIVNTTDQVPVAITFDQYSLSEAMIAKFSTAQALAILEVPPDQATSAAGESNVTTVSVKGLADQVASSFDSLVLLGDKVDSVEITDSNALELTQVQYETNGATIAKINGAFDLVILG